MVVNSHQHVGRTWHSLLEVRDKFIIIADVFRYSSVDVHKLDREVDQLGRRIRRPGAQDVLLAQDGGMSLDDEAGPLVTIPHHGGANDDPLVGLELNFQGHVRPPSLISDYTTLV